MRPKSKEIFLYLFIGALLMLSAHLALYLFGWLGQQTQTLMPGYLFIYPCIYAVAAFILAHREGWGRRLTYMLLAPFYYWLWNYMQGYDRQLELPFVMRSISMLYVLAITVLFAFAIGYIRRRTVIKGEKKDSAEDQNLN